MPDKRERSLVASSRYLGLKYSYDRAPLTRYPEKLVARLTETVYGGTGRLLDLGCGRGDFLEAFRRAGFDAAGTDINRDRHKDAIYADLEEGLPFGDSEFDFIFCKSVVEHLTDATVALSEVRRVMRPGGRIVVLTPSWPHTGREIFFSEYTHVRPFTRQSLAEVLTLAGYANARAEYFWQFPLIWRLPALRLLTLLPRVLSLPYRPLNEARWPPAVNRAIRFSREVMVIGVAENPDAV